MLQSKHPVPPEKHWLHILKNGIYIILQLLAHHPKTFLQTNTISSSFLLFNHFLLLNHDSHTFLSDSLVLKSLNRLSFHTPNFSLLFSSNRKTPHMTSSPVS